MRPALRPLSIAIVLAISGGLVGWTFLARGPVERTELADVELVPQVPAEETLDDPPASTAPEPGVERVALARPPSVPMAQRQLEASGAPLGIFRGRLVYATTGQGVPWCGVMLYGAELQDLYCITDAEGRFQSQYEMPLARTWVRVQEHRSGYSAREGALELSRASADEEVVLVHDAQPTLALEGAFPAGLDPATLKVSVESAEGLSRMSNRPLRLRGDRWFVRGSRTSGPGSTLWLASRSTPPAASEDRSKGNAPWRVTLEGDRAVWHGVATIDSLEGVVAVAPVWQACGVVVVTLRGNWGSPPAWGTRVELRPAFGDSLPRQVSALLPALIAEPASFSGLQSGAYTVTVRCEACPLVEVPVTVRAGEVTNVEVKLACPAVAGSIRGEVTTESGKAPPEAQHLEAELLGTDWSRREPLVRDPNSSTWKATFWFRDVPGGEFQVECPVGEFGVESSHARGARAGDIVRLKVLDRTGYVDLGFRAFDAETGEELATLRVDWSLGGEGKSLRGVRSGEIVVEHFPSNGRLWFSVSSPGYSCVEGPLDPRSWTTADGAQRWIEVRLRRGWSVLCCALESETHAGLAGAAVVVDGTVVGSTDEDGLYHLVLPERPRSLELRHGDRLGLPDPAFDLAGAESCDVLMFAFARR